MFSLSDNISRVKPSATLEVTAKAKKLKAQGKDIIGFGAGEPDFDTPQHIKQALYDAVEEGFIYYTPTPGIPELREAIAGKLKRDNNVIRDPQGEIIATPGAKQALYEAIMAVTNPGDEILIPDPWWVSYVPMVQMANGKEVFVPTTKQENFELKSEALLEKVTKKSKALILNSPSNPTGAVIEKKTLRAISDICQDHNIIVISDEIYEPIIYGKEHVSIGSFDGMADRAVTINGFSKSYSMTGWRLGYAAGPAEIIKLMTRIQAHSVSNATSFVQKAGVVALNSSQECVETMRQEFEKRKGLIVKMLREIEGVTCTEPNGAFYAFPDFSNLEKDDFKLTDYLLEEAGVAVIPGSAFGEQGKGFIRLSYAISTENIIEGIKRIKDAMERI